MFCVVQPIFEGIFVLAHKIYTIFCGRFITLTKKNSSQNSFFKILFGFDEIKTPLLHDYETNYKTYKHLKYTTYLRENSVEKNLNAGWMYSRYEISKSLKFLLSVAGLFNLHGLNQTDITYFSQLQHQVMMLVLTL